MGNVETTEVEKECKNFINNIKCMYESRIYILHQAKSKNTEELCKNAIEDTLRELDRICTRYENNAANNNNTALSNSVF